MTSPAAAQVTVSLQWTDADGNVCRPTPKTIACPYSVVVTGSVPIPAGTPANTEFDIPFPGIPGDASLVLIENETDAEMICAWGGQFAPDVPPGGVVLLANPGMRTGNSINPGAAYRLITRVAAVTGGALVYRVFGT